MKVRRGALDAIVGHALAEAPLECCGLLIGDEASIEGTHPAENLRRSRTAYQVAPADHFSAIRAARAEGRRVIGAYHSHPASPARPSATDVAEANDPAFVHVIVSLAAGAPDVRAYLIADQAFAEVVLEAIP